MASPCELEKCPPCIIGTVVLMLWVSPFHIRFGGTRNSEMSLNSHTRI